MDIPTEACPDCGTPWSLNSKDQEYYDLRDVDGIPLIHHAGRCRDFMRDVVEELERSLDYAMEQVQRIGLECDRQSERAERAEASKPWKNPTWSALDERKAIVDWIRSPAGKLVAMSGGSSSPQAAASGAEAIADVLAARTTDLIEEKKSQSDETELRGRLSRLRSEMLDIEDALESIHRGTTGTFGRLRYGDRVRLNYDYGLPHSAKKGDVGKVTYIWPDGQVAVEFDDGNHAAYWPNVLEWAPEQETKPNK